MAIAAVPASAASTTQDCPNAQTGKSGFVVERAERQKSEVFHIDADTVTTTMRYDGKTLLQTVQFRGLFLLDRIDEGRRTKFEPRTDLKSLFPLKVGSTVTAKFMTQDGGQFGRLWIEFQVKAEDDVMVGGCRYNVLKLERSESRGRELPSYVYTDYYSPDLKLILAKEYPPRNGRSRMIKYDRIYPFPR